MSFLNTDTAHYSEVLALVSKVERSLWIGTADIKDLYIKSGSEAEPFLAVLAQLIKKGRNGMNCSRKSWPRPRGNAAIRRDTN